MRWPVSLPLGEGVARSATDKGNGLSMRAVRLPHRGGTPEPPVSLSPKVKVARPEVATDEGAGLGRVVGAAHRAARRWPEWNKVGVRHGKVALSDWQ